MNTKLHLLSLSALFLASVAGCEVAVPPSADGGIDGAVVAPGACVVGGCSGQLCVSADIDPPATTCEWLEEYACYADSTCEVQPDGNCGWTLTDELMQCLADAREPAPVEPSAEPPVEPPPVDGECITSGCSGQLCVPADADPIGTTCEWREEYACYQAAACEKQADGACGWTPTDELAQCLANSGAAAQ